MKKTCQYLNDKKQRGEKITMLTCYDYPTAVWEDEAGVDIIFVGDSVGTNVLGYESEREVTMDDMVHHLRAVRRGVSTAYLLCDLPYMTCETPEQALENASLLLSHGADGVKLEGFKPNIVKHLAEHEIEVCAHLGLNPQIHDKAGLKAKEVDSAIKLIEDSLALEEAGACFIVYEVVPEEVAQEATQRLSIPTIGIGAGRHTDGQVLIVSDMLGINAFDLRHSKKFEDFHGRAIKAIEAYVSDVQRGLFPEERHARHLQTFELEAFKKKIRLL
ncbi:3-methyl-2-oxobutanoate hydroxymethyltransferase [Candidatus Hydrogenedentota bacterium]